MRGGSLDRADLTQRDELLRLVADLAESRSAATKLPTRIAAMMEIIRCVRREHRRPDSDWSAARWIDGAVVISWLGTRSMGVRHAQRATRAGSPSDRAERVR